MNEATLFDNIEHQNPFNGIRVYLSGTFSRPNSEIIFKLTNAGANTKMGLAKTTCVIIAGSNQSDKDLEKIDILSHDGFHIPIIDETEALAIITGEKNASFYEPVKNVNITYDYIFNSRVPKIQHFNFFEHTHPLGQKELFLHEIKGNQHLLYQSLGNIGSYGNSEFDPKSIDFCWLKQETIDKLRQGGKDRFIDIITEKYNQSDSDKFTYKFVIESEAIYWMEYRATEVGDKLSLDLITRYKNSICTIQANSGIMISV